MKIIVLLNEASIWNDIQILFIIPIIKEFNIISNFITDHYFLSQDILEQLHTLPYFSLKLLNKTDNELMPYYILSMMV